jgi:hypothetical protein
MDEAGRGAFLEAALPCLDAITQLARHLSITASKGYVDYWQRDPAVAGVNANRTEFHQIH